MEAREFTGPIGGFRAPDDVREPSPALIHAPTLVDEQLLVDQSRASRRSVLLRRTLGGADVSVGAAAGLMLGAVSGHDTVSAFGFAAIVAMAWPLLLFVCGLYSIRGLGSWASGIGELGRLVGVALALSWLLVAATSALRLDHPFATAVSSAGVTVALTILSRALSRGVLHQIHGLRQRTVIIGSGVVAGQLVKRLRIQKQFGLDPIGILDDDYHHVESLDLPMLGRLQDLPEVLRTHRVDRVMIAFSRADHRQLLESIRVCRLQRVAVDVIPRLFEFLEGARGLDQIGGLPVLSIGAPRLSRSSRAAKRGLDIVVSLFALVLLSPLLAVLALAVKADSRGSALFRQPRAGRDGKVFRLIKFRSMYTDAETRKADLEAVNDQSDGVMFKIHDDPRISRVGRVLRKLSLDELPQLVNVLCGEMSLVGPRPLILPESQALGEGWHARRLDLRPGITGPWQISGRSDVSVHDMVRLDFQYVTSWSLARDLEILLATLPVMVTGRGAY